MATITGLTAARMLEIEAASVVDGDVIGDNLILTTKGGSQIDAGSVRGPKGDVGPVGQDLAVISAKPVLDVGLFNQIRAGRQLTVQDFTAMGLAAPLGLWNLSDLTDASGNARTLVNKGAILFGVGINGTANTAAQFSGSTAQAFYISDTGANDAFRIKTGSWGCWFRTAKRGLNQSLISKRGASALFAFGTGVGAANFQTFISFDGSSVSVNISGVTDVCDDRWHFGVVTFDGTMLRLYVDGILEGVGNGSGAIFGSSAPFNIGSLGADGATVATEPNFGRIDEAFITADVLTDDQVRNLYCAKIAHTLSSTPVRVSLNVRRRRKGPAFIAGDFPAQPLRLYNFSGGSLADDGSNATNLTNPGNAVAVAGADGTTNNAINFNGSQSLAASDTGLPSDLSAFPKRSCGFWMKTTYQSAATIMGWGAGALGASDIRVGINFGLVFSTSAGDTIANAAPVADGQWHFVVEVDDNVAIDGLKRKLYADGKLVGASSVMNPVVLGGANRFRIGVTPDGTAQVYTGQVDGVFVCALALTTDQIIALYAKGSQALSASPKSVGDHVEAIRATDLLAIFDTLESQHQIDLAVA